MRRGCCAMTRHELRAAVRPRCPFWLTRPSLHDHDARALAVFLDVASLFAHAALTAAVGVFFAGQALAPVGRETAVLGVLLREPDGCVRGIAIAELAHVD